MLNTEQNITINDIFNHPEKWVDEFEETRLDVVDLAAAGRAHCARMNGEEPEPHDLEELHSLATRLNKVRELDSHIHVEAMR